MTYIGEIPENLNFTKEHEWVRFDGHIAVMGITDYAQHALTDVVFVELPEIGKKVQQLKPFCVVESVKSVSDIYAPISGDVVEVNKDLREKPEYINKDAYSKGWIAKIEFSDKSETSNLMDHKGYKKYLEGLKH
ncbi:MAG: glycine cleavage system protein GcvH [Nanoarchaeota archaeon]